MFQSTSKETIQSAVQPGVSYTIRRLNRIERAMRDLGTIEHRARVSEILTRAREVGDGANESEKQEARVLDYELAQLSAAYLQPASIRAALMSIDGLEVDGKPVKTADDLMSGGPEVDDLLDEIYIACERASGLAGEQQKNSDSPSTSGAPAEVETQVSGVATAA